MLISLMSYSQTAIAPSGSGSSSDPYLISSLENLYWISTSLISNSNFSDNKFFLQTNDIDASDTANWTNNWIPIGGRTTLNLSNNSDDENRIFSGVYNGGGYSISNVTYVNTYSGNNLNGFFGVITGIVMNLKLLGISMTTNSAKTGGLVGLVKVGGRIYNCSTTGIITSSNVAAGGIVGQNQGVVYNSYSSCDVSGTNVIGGLIGLNQRNVYDCYSNGSITSSNNFAHIGGLIAEYSTNPLFRSYANTTLTLANGSSTNYDGGLIGRLRIDMSDVIGSENYWNTDLYTIGKGSVNTNTFFGEGLTSIELQDVSNFGSNWDFVHTWAFGIDGYPTLVNKPNTWLGVDSNWNNTANWSLGTVPSSNNLAGSSSSSPFLAKDLVYIPANLSNYPSLTGNITAYSITLEAGAVLSSNGFNINRTFYIEQEISNSNTWTGNTNTLWNEASNWSAQSVPDNTNNIIIPNTANKPKIESNVTLENLTLQTGAILTIDPLKSLKVNGDILNDGLIIFKSESTGTGVFDTFTGTISGSGSVQVERYIPARRAFRFLSPAVTTTTSINENWQEDEAIVTGLGTHITGNGGAANGFDATATNNPSMFGFNNNNGQWEAVTNTDQTVLTAGTPYRLMVRGDRTTDLTTNTPTPTVTTLRATGTLYTGDFTPALNSTVEGFSFIGNPYQAPLDMKAALVASTNMNEDVLYYWDPTLNTRGAYVTRTLGDASNNVSSGFTEILQPGQAVFTKKDGTAAAATMTITEAHKKVADGAAGVFRPSTNSIQSSTTGLLRANLQATINNQWQTTDAALALFDTNYTWGVTQEDASKINNLDEEVSFMLSNTSLAIAKQNGASATDELPIRLNKLRHTDYRWIFDLTNYNGAIPYLLDTEQNIFSVIDNGTIVPFTAGNNASNRFKIVFQNTTLSIPTIENTISLYPNPSKGTAGFYMNNTALHTKVDLYTSLGQPVPVRTTLNGTTMHIQPKMPLSKGVYLVQLTTPEGRTNQAKWIVE